MGSPEKISKGIWKMVFYIFDRRFYVSTKMKYVLSLIFAICWVLFSLWIAKTWIDSLAGHTGYFVSYFIVFGVAIIPGFLNSFLISSLLLDVRPPRKKIDEKIFPDISILIAAYNEEDNIETTLESIKNEYYTKNGKTTVIVINDGSTDKTKEKLSNYDKYNWIKIINLEKNVGKANALNAGLLEVKTDLLITIDADSILYNNAILRLVERYLLDPDDTIAVAGAVLVGNSRNNFVTKIQEWDYFHGIASVKRVQSLYGGTLVAQGAFSLYETEEILKVGGWPDTIGEDIVLTWALLGTGKRIGFAEDACLFTNAPETWGKFIRQRQRWSRGLIEAFKKHWRLLFKARLSTLFIWSNFTFPYLDLVYTFVFIPGVIMAFFGYYYIASLITLLVLPLAVLVNYIMFRIQRRMFTEQNLKVRKNIFGFIYYALFYGLILQPACVIGYIKEIFSFNKTWGTK